MLDADGYVTSWNPGAERFKGYKATEIIGQHFSRFYTEEDRQRGLPQRALDTAATEGKFEGEGWRVRRDGSLFSAHIVIDPIRDPSGKLIGFAKITRDLSERRVAEAALRRSEEQFRLLVQGVTDYSIYMLDPDGIVTNWNAGAEKIKGYSPQEIVGQHFSKFYTDEDRERGDPQNALQVARREGRFEREGWRVRKDGTRFWANVVIDAIHDDQGQLLGYAKITRDITERLEAQRTLDIAREALLQSQKMDAIGQLTGGMAHDFNNLLMAVLGSLELVRRRMPRDARISPLIDNAIQGAERGKALTQRMLAFARRQELAPKRIDIPDLVCGMADLLKRSIGPTIAVEMRFPLSITPVLVDANQLELVLLNLLVNARDAMPAGGIVYVAADEVEVRAGHETNLPAGRYVRLSVTDTGEGMDAATLARAAEPFFTTKGVGKGTGLGLAMVHGMAEQSGGRLAITSTEGKGTTVAIWLPAAPVAVAVAADNDTIESGVPAAHRGLRILAVDDDVLVLTNTAAMLDELGHEAVTAASGAQALEILRTADGVDLVITDQAMPTMTGVQLAAAVRGQHSGLPVLLATGFAELPAGDEAGWPKLAKPFSLDELKRAITEVMAGRASARA
jgi:PAS domain S-box-containing protein